MYAIFDMDVVYRPQNNPFMDFLIHRSRARVYKNQIAKDNMRSLIEKLKMVMQSGIALIRTLV